MESAPAPIIPAPGFSISFFHEKVGQTPRKQSIRQRWGDAKTNGEDLRGLETRQRILALPL